MGGHRRNARIAARSLGFRSTWHHAPQLTALANPRIAKTMAKMRYTSAHIAEGKRRLIGLLPDTDPVVVKISGGSQEQIDAQDQAGTWDEQNFTILRALVDLFSVEAGAWVFHEISAEQGLAESIRVVSTVVERVDKVLSGDAGLPIPEGLEAELERMGYGKQERDRVRDLVDVALGPNGDDSAAPIAVDPSPEQLLAERNEKVLELKRWVDFTAALAKKGGLNKADLIRMGLAKRASPKKKTAEAPAVA